jgi:RHH-type rel operon transcriptional repressor/antitoxin RelB
MIAVRVPEDIEIRLDKLAQLTGRTKTYYVREAIVEHLDDMEDLYLAEKVVQDIRAGREQLIPIDEVARAYGLDD